MRLLLVDPEPVKITHDGKELEAIHGDNNIITIDRNIATLRVGGMAVYLFLATFCYCKKEKRLELKCEPVPHTGELVPLNPVFASTAVVRSATIHHREPFRESNRSPFRN
jgi:hypothetical protein